MHATLIVNIEHVWILTPSPKRTLYFRTQWYRYGIPSTVCITHPWCGFQSPIARQPRGCQYRTIRVRKALGEPRGCQYRTIRVRKALGEMFPAPSVLARTVFQLLWRYRSWRIGPGWCDTRYGTWYGSRQRWTSESLAQQ